MSGTPDFTSGTLVFTTVAQRKLLDCLVLVAMGFAFRDPIGH